MIKGIKIDGVAQLLAEMRSVGQRVPENARKTMHRNADVIVREAQLNTPVDKHNLELSIRKEVAYGFRGRLQIDIVAGGFVNGVDVDRYILEVHENYDSRKPGPGTLAKMAANPGRLIGAQFLERALRAQEEKLRPQMIEAVLRGIKEGGL